MKPITLCFAVLLAVEDDKQRHNAAQNLARSYFGNDPIAAEKWVNGLNLPDAQKSQLLKLRP
jgi:hypothetical protein